MVKGIRSLEIAREEAAHEPRADHRQTAPACPQLLASHDRLKTFKQRAWLFGLFFLYTYHVLVSACFF